MILPIYLGPQEHKVALMELEDSPRRGRINVLSIVRRAGKPRCPQCGREHAEAFFEEVEAIRFRDRSRGGFEMYFEVHLVRVVLRRDTYGGDAVRDAGLPDDATDV